MKKLAPALCALLFAFTGPAMARGPSYHAAASIAAADGGWDYASVDPVAHRLYVARGSSVTVIDTRANALVGEIGSVAHGHAVVPLPGQRLLVTSGDDESVRILAAGDGREVGRIGVGKKPDAAILSHDGHIAYVMNADDGTVAVIDVAAMAVRQTITVRPALEYAALTPDGTLFVNNEDANAMEVIDLAHGAAGVAIPLPGCEAPSGLAFDAGSWRLIAACANGKAAIVDARHRTLIDLIEIGRGPDAVILDATRRLAFLPCGKDGVLDILSLDGARVKRIGRVTTAIGARTGALDPTTGAIYLPTADFVPADKPGARPSTKPGTFSVIVVRRG